MKSNFAHLSKQNTGTNGINLNMLLNVKKTTFYRRNQRDEYMRFNTFPNKMGNGQLTDSAVVHESHAQHFIA
jgi:hypothetical protein